MSQTLRTQYPIRSSLAVSAVALLGCFGFLIWDQSAYWMSHEDYAFFGLLPFLAVFICYIQWPAWRSVLKRPLSAHLTYLDVLAALQWSVGLLLFVLGAFIRSGAGTLIAASLMIALGFALSLLAGAFLMSSREGLGLNNRFRLLRTLSFPAAIWLLSIPLFPPVELAIKDFLMSWVISGVSGVFEILAWPIQVEGRQIIFEEGPLLVAEACSGIRSLRASLIASIFLAVLFLNSFPKKIALVLWSVLWVTCSNFVRTFVLSAAAHLHGVTAVDGWFHDVIGWLFLAMNIIGILFGIMLLSIEWSLEKRDDFRLIRS